MFKQIFDMVDAKARQDCIKEIDLLKQLNHPNVIKYLSSFVENNEVSPAWNVMELHCKNLALHCSPL